MSAYISEKCARGFHNSCREKKCKCWHHRKDRH